MGLIVHTHDLKLSQEISYKLESEAFVRGYYFAFSLSDCALCKSALQDLAGLRAPKSQAGFSQRGHRRVQDGAQVWPAS